MILRTILSIVAIFVLWSGLDYLVHAVLLIPTYDATAEFWRPEEELLIGLMAAVRFAISVTFVLIFAYLIRPKSLGTGLAFGLALGFATGVGMGYGTYCFMPIPQGLAASWFAATVVKFGLAGAIVGLIMKENMERENSGEAT